MCKNFGKGIVFAISHQQVNCSTPLSHINVENYILYVGKVYVVRKINIAIGGRGEIIMDERVIDFQNLFAHDFRTQDSMTIIVVINKLVSILDKGGFSFFDT